ncbi:AbrB/MazE/SpoVT family DNA-binding domain-containing protein [Planococcus lenghuensis]|uniref:SpoVT-AbrB domain-containing protein n=1 Tax=Planococcus lenghuensis TaxID=2213202 RepID=A0A1Q2KY75_9BACL|nr:AbrB/MazE/SpoVT family DNA-binding domain-containing protein [Planococcus lenghuensis]AQQ53175.1 hypothetical protein B0X71_08805 [Planococcus lenghuensis]
MHTNRINKLGRLVIPKDLLEIFQLQEGSCVDIRHTDTQIIIEPHKNALSVPITEKIMKEAIEVGEARISKEDMKGIVAYMNGE